MRERVGAAAVPLAAFGVTVCVGVAGFVALTGISVVDAAFWLLDPTSLELYFERHSGPERTTKVFAVVVFVALVLAGIWVGESALDAAFDGRLGRELTRMQTQRAIDDLRGHVVICGHGMFGRTVANRLREQGRDVVVVERDDEERERMADDAPVVGGDARREEVLERAGVARADAVVAGIDDSNANIQIGVATSQLAPEATLVVRVGDEMYESTARRVGADTVVIPEVVSGSDLVADL
ncbi:TrkA-N domain-containing protein [Halosimplex carlsbadense 2-9-1]|uniref:TrkA-N domain-containing protein n=1 Tax=Halosimplex carlsbadense 2-9-1 TaxID=797114 RepID=M0D0X6_9EURY|nr:TrkA-N domain-containing protein [Halosimplex carlsbadense 2-9-1]